MDETRDARNETPEPVKVGHPVRSIHSGRLGMVREITDHGYMVKFTSHRQSMHVRFDDVRPA